MSGKKDLKYDAKNYTRSGKRELFARSLLKKIGFHEEDQSPIVSGLQVVLKKQGKVPNLGDRYR